jgi:hypothetical protein
MPWRRIIMKISWVTQFSILTAYRRKRATFLDFLELISSPKTTSY